MAVLITGASGGLGLEFAKLFAADGCDLVLVARSEGKLQKIKRKLEETYHIRAEVCVMDLSVDGAAKQVWEFTQEKNIPVETLVNNAGFGDYGRFAESDLETQNRMIHLNILALTELCHYYLQPMLQRGRGEILNLCSTAAFQPGPLMSVYYATKAFVLSFTQALWTETKGTGVTCMALCPGPTATGFEKAAHLESSGLFKNLKNATAKEVAAYGYRQLKRRKKAVAIQGISNQALIVASKFSPRPVVREIVYRIQKESRSKTV